MAITIIATPKATNANSYATVAESDAYHETHLYSDAWDNADAEKQRASLVWATRILDDFLTWVGAQTTSEQALDWPRIGIDDENGTTIDQDTIPQELTNATSELARKLLEADRTADRDTIGFSKIQVGPITLDVDKFDEIKVIPDSVRAMLNQWIEGGFEGGSTVKLVRA